MASISLTISAVFAIVLGLLVLLFPRFLRWAVGLYFLVFGITQLLNQYF